MLTIETERLIAKFLIKLSEEELKVQRYKVELLNNYDFNPYECFNYLDKKLKESIDYYDIFNFMRDNSISITLSESFLIILYYDTKDQNFWSYENFVNFLLNYSENNNIKRINFISNRKGQIKDKIIKLLLDIFKSELQLIHTTMPLIFKIKDRIDYNINDLFKSLSFNTDKINIKNISEFLYRNGYDNYPDKKIDAIINRLSISKNSFICFDDLEKIIENGYCNKNKNDLFEYMLNAKNDFYKINQKFNYNDIKSSNDASSNSYNIFNSENQKDDGNKEIIHMNNFIKNNDNPSKNNSFGKNKRIINKNRKNSEKENNIKKNKYNEKDELLDFVSIDQIEIPENQGNFKNIDGNNILEIPEEKYFVDYLLYILGNESLIEQKKTKLVLKYDFNIKDCILLFKPNQSKEEFISHDEFIYGTQSLELTFDDEEIKLLFCKYDLMNNGFLTFSDFFDLLVPFNIKYREIIQNRKSMKRDFNTKEIFCDETKNCLKNLFQCICISEINIEKERHKLMRYLNDMSLFKIFNKIDKDKKGFLVSKDLFDYLRSWNAISFGSDFDLIFIRLDRDRNGIVTLNDIISEISIVLSEKIQSIN